VSASDVLSSEVSFTVSIHREAEKRNHLSFMSKYFIMQCDFWVVLDKGPLNVCVCVCVFLANSIDVMKEIGKLFITK